MEGDDFDREPIVLVAGYLIFFMQCGFCMLCVGSVREKNAKNIILKNLLDACFGALGFYVLGYGLSSGADSGSFIGGSNFALQGVSKSDYKTWFFEYAFAATSATIVSGAVAERTKFEAYLLYSFYVTAWVYPVVAHWIWNEEGWLSIFRTDGDLFLDSGVLDYAGCGVVHMTGGFAGLWAAWIVGPRVGRFYRKDVGSSTSKSLADDFSAPGPLKVKKIPGHSASLALLGIFILWFGWYGFNSGAALHLGAPAQTASLCAVNTTLGGAAGCVSALILQMLFGYRRLGVAVWDLITAGNGVLAGLVSVTAACSVIQPWAALVAGLVGGVIYVLSSYLVSHILKVDDPLDAVAVHGFGGMWGLIAGALFADAELFSFALDHRMNKVDIAVEVTRPGGLFMENGNARLLGSALVAILVILGWVMVCMVPFFLVLRAANILRVSTEHERHGLDVVHHGGTAYPKDYASDDFLVAAGSPTAGTNRLSFGQPSPEVMSELNAIRQNQANLEAKLMRILAQSPGTSSSDPST
ncbi:hypothetical protein BSKO_05781 [Bryopsis sp. KO-2023]|nr:hypothetical protein BSKO_05781 [Bryopsis sp. KO-2023]